VSIEIRSGWIVDPQHPMHARASSIWIEGEQIIEAPDVKLATANEVFDASGCIVMAGGIDIHTHIGGGKVNLARMLQSAQPSDERTVWPTRQTGKLYNDIGYTSCFEPAMLLPTARHTHWELRDTPGIDAGAYVVLGNEDWLLEQIGRGIEAAELDALVGWAVSATRALAIKVVNPGGINAFRFNQRKLDVDEHHLAYGVTPRDVVRELTASAVRLGLPHPLHVHASNLGVPGNIESTLATLSAAEGHPIHLTHAQFNCYGDKGKFGMSSAAEELSRFVNQHDNVTLDVGQVVFGQTVTISADTRAQYENTRYADGKRWIVSDVGASAGCGVVPMRYEDDRFVHSLQWCIGLELLLLIEDPWRVFLTTDHPNGGPFTCYPHLMRLLMDKSFRQDHLDRIHPDAAGMAVLQEIDREYTIDEIAIITRLAPAKILSLKDRGSLVPGQLADVSVFRRHSDDWEATFNDCVCLVKNGQMQAVQAPREIAGRLLHARPQFDQSVVSRYSEVLTETYGCGISGLEISQAELDDIYRT